MDNITLALAKAYVNEKMSSVSGVKGDKGDTGTSVANVEINDENHLIITLSDSSTIDAGLIETVSGKDGSDGVGISKIEKIGTVDLVDTYRITFTDNSTFDYEVKNGADGQGGTGGSGTAEDTTYTNENFPQYDNVDLALDALFNKVYYVKPTCSLSATPSGGTFEIGTAISAPITFTWTTNKDITSQTLTGCTLANASVRTATYNTNVTSDKTFTLSVSDDENFASSSVSYKFLNNIFWGSASTAETYDSAFISALSNKKLASVIKGTYSFNIASGEYGFWAVPSNMTISSVWIGGFEVTVDDLGTVSYTNAQGYTRDYKLYKTGKASLGAISAEIK